MKQQILLLLVFSFLTSCVSTKRFTGFVESKFQPTKNIIDNTPGAMSFDLSELERLSSPVISTKLKSQFIPAILYWQWNTTIKCEINPIIIATEIKQTFIRYADSLGLQNKLQGRKLEIKIEKIPNNFVYTHYGHTLFLIIAYAISDVEAIFPQDQNMIISYRLIENDSAIKEGNVIAKNKSLTIQNGSKSTKKFTWMYVDQFKRNTERLTKEIVQEIVKEI